MSCSAKHPFDGTLRQLRAWAHRHGGYVSIIHRNPRGVIELVQGGVRTVYHHDKYGKRDGRYSWSSTYPVDFLVRAVNG
jgi:hypothetical protein